MAQNKTEAPEESIDTDDAPDSAQEEHHAPDPRVTAAHQAYRSDPASQHPSRTASAEQVRPSPDEEADEVHAAEYAALSDQEDEASELSAMEDALRNFSGIGSASSAKVTALEEENATLKDQLMRAIAETDNIRKRSEREKDDLGKYAVAGFARDLVGVAENLYRALDSVPEEARTGDDSFGTLFQGVDMTLQEMLKIFEQNGIMRIDPTGEPFDHNFHQAVAQVESAEHPPGTVLQVIQSGYVIKDRLLRPAMVTVTKKPAESA